MNQIALYGATGWVGSAVVQAFEQSGADLRVLHRQGSDISALSDSTRKVQIDVGNEDSLTSALKGADILICLVGHGGFSIQHNLIKAAKRAGVKLLVPSELASRDDTQGLECISVNREKLQVEKAAEGAGLPMAIVLAGNFAEFALNTLALGVDLEGNRMVYTDNSDTEVLNICTRPYVAAAFVQLFSSTPVKELSGRIIRLTEVQVTGKQITEALTRKHSQAPSIRREESREFEALIDHDTPGALALYCRKIWGKGQQESMLGQDTFEVADYHKATLDDLIVEGGLGEYRPLPSFVQDLMRSLFEGTDCDM